MRVEWAQLKRLVGLPTATADQEGQLRYVRDGAVDGLLRFARKLSGGTFEWATVSFSDHSHAAHNPTLFASASDDSSIAVTTTLADVLTTTIGPLVSGVVYDIELTVAMRGSVDTAGYCRAYARIGSDSSVIGTKTGTVAGERTIMATATRSGQTGSGSSITVRARADMDVNTGSVTGVHVWARAIPRS